MFEKILLPYDGSEHSKKAADYVIKLAKFENSKVEILHVRDSVNKYPSRVVYDAHKLDKMLLEDAEEILSQAVEKFKDAGVQYTAKIMAGDPANIICEEVDENNIKVIVMGSRGLNPVVGFVLGSVTTKVLHKANCSVFIVR